MKLDRKRLLFLTMFKYTQKYILNKKSTYPRYEKRLPKASLIDHHEKTVQSVQVGNAAVRGMKKINIYIR